jgi:winged helix-turn-helix
MSSFFVSQTDEEYLEKRKRYRLMMKDFNITKKYFKSIFGYIFCEICSEIIDVEIDKEKIRNGLQTGLYIYKHIHTNPLHDEDEPEDLSNQEHTCMIYIDAKYEVRGVRTFFGQEISSEELEKGSKIPIVVKEIPPMSVHLGMLSPEEYKILQTCDGNNTLKDVAEIAGLPVENLEKMMNKLREKGLINIIRRS